MSSQDKSAVARGTKYGKGEEHTDGPLNQFLSKYEEAVAADQALDRLRERKLRQLLERRPSIPDSDTDEDCGIHFKAPKLVDGGDKSQDQSATKNRPPQPTN